MGNLFRSEEMTLCQLFLQSEAAYNSISEIGELGLVQFRDLNPDVNAFQRKFVHEVRRCDEMERRLRFIEKEIKADGMPMLEMSDVPDAPQPREMIEMEANFERFESDLKEVLANSQALERTYLELTELKYILEKAQGFFDEVSTMSPASLTDDAILIDNLDADDGKKRTMNLSFVTGVIGRDRMMMFERMLWRVCRGNVFMKTSDIEVALENPLNPSESTLKTVFIIYFQGEQLKSRVRKICEGCRAVLYPCPETMEDRREMLVGVSSRLDDLDTVMKQTQEHRNRILVDCARIIKPSLTKVRKIKAIYYTLNMFNFDVTQKALIGECWCPVADLGRIRMALKRGGDMSGSQLPAILNQMDTKESPPTFNRTNKFTSGFQAIVDAYGAANYREVNPAPFTIITFPFLFAVMFGDAGHGLIMLLAALYLVVKERQIKAMNSRNEIFLNFFNGRYIILLMGIFSMYTGFIYNDVFAKALNIFGSKWTATNGTDHLLQIDPTKHYDANGPYPFGIDPVWQTSSNKILFLNSYKMKLSVILGVSQMLFGTMMSLFNHTYFKKPVNIYCEFIPQVIFLMSIFGYLIILVVAKFIMYDAATSGCAPSILITLINMFLQKYSTDPKDPCNLKPMYGGQQVVQTVLVVLALVCVPWMLFIKPFVLRSQARAKEALKAGHGPRPVVNGSGGQSTSNGRLADKEAEADEQASVGLVMAPDMDGHEEEEFQMAEVFIEQAIHTIEYCLGSISHTASYLRLWALSLAHAQLSEVLWNMVMVIGLTGNFAFMYLAFAFWAILTVAVLLLMEGLSAFLHALRLHWVEFQSKFYKGEGKLFEPFSMAKILQLASADD
ncbi:putative V-type proton ATPase subunit [Halotydeus destructor]|nr:putative V-type proton ATPase subunit [Halotydeus destructor]